MKTTALWITGAMVVAMGTAGVASAKGMEFGAHGPRGAFMQEMFAEIDADGDGKVTKEEIEAFKTARFEATDTDGDGKLSREEIAAARDARRVARMQTMVERLDQDGDGLLSADELAAGPARRAPQDMFDRLDADDDGALTLEEIEKARGAFQRGGKSRFGHKDRKHGHRGGHGHHGGMGFPFFGGPDMSDDS
ncbi:EF-hand domain-containing protein [Mameliella sp. AT18]|uniref:EF-hand domain-containing protein n=1 Tax=Mameliella sp. AT18 TaxID=3028385 RepID=UPI001112D723|nr:EF-hand domain-containing protein [Mameliella sp. AT18]MDD9729799.1 EF-hand domain-containing protein [Mameliella sp. AT18]